MANPQTGEVEFESGGTTYVLRCDANTLIAVQLDCKLADDEFWSIVGASLSISLPMLRAFFYRGVRIAGAKLGSWDEAGRLITALGTHRAVHLVSDAITWCLPPKPEQPEGERGSDESPPRPSPGPMSS